MSDERKDLPPANSPNFLEKVREAVQTYLGNRGNRLDRGLTVRDLADAGLINVNPSFVGGGGKEPPISGAGPAVGGQYEPDLTPPPTPTGFTATAAISNIMVSCDVAAYTAGHGHAKSRLYGATWVSGALPVFTDAVVLEEFSGTVFSHATNPATTWHLWLTWVTVDGKESLVPAGGTNGVAVTTGQNVSSLLTALQGEITTSQLHADLGSRIDVIDLIDDPITGLSTLMAQAQGSINAINATLADISGTPDYDAATAYVVGNIVKYSGGLYKAVAATTGNLPTDTAYWSKIGDYASLGDAVAAYAVELADHATRIETAEGTLTSTASSLSGLRTQMRGDYAGTDLSAVSSGLIHDEREARSTADATEVQERKLLSATLIGVDDPTGKTLSTLSSGILFEEKTARVTAVGAVAERVTTLETDLSDPDTGLGSKASILYADQAKSDAISASANATRALMASTAAFDAALTWNFDADVEGWGSAGLWSLSASGGSLVVPSHTSDPMLWTPVISIDGSKNTIIRARIKRVAGTGWQGQVYYETAVHSYSESYTKTVTDTTVLNEWRIVEWDMSNLTAGGSDWVSNTITRIRFDLGQGAAADDVFHIDWVTIGRSYPVAYSAAIKAEETARSGETFALAQRATTLEAKVPLAAQTAKWNSVASRPTIFDTTFENPDAWTGGELVASDGLSGGTVLRAVGEGYILSTDYMPVDTSRIYMSRCRAKQVSGTGTFFAGFACYDKDKNYISADPPGWYYNYSAFVNATLPNTWTTGFGIIKDPVSADADPFHFRTGTAYVRLMMLCNYGGTGTTEVDLLEFFDITEAYQASLSASEAKASIVTIETAKIGYATKGGAVFDDGGTITDKAGVDAWNAAHPSDLAVWHAGLPLAQAVKQISISDGETTATLEQRATAQKTINGDLALSYTIKLDAGDKVAGYGLYNSTGSPSEFAIRADRFYMAAPEGTPDYAAYVDYSPTNDDLHTAWSADNAVSGISKVEWGYSHWINAGQAEGRHMPTMSTNFKPFVMQATPTTINGRFIHPGVYMDSAYIINLNADFITGGTINGDIVNVTKALTAADITAGALWTGDATSTSNTVVDGVSVPSFKLNAQTGLATFNNAVVRGTVYATNGVFSGTIQGGTASSYGSGVGLWAGLDGGTYKFRVGSPDNAMSWDGTVLRIGGVLASTIATNASVAPITFIGDYASAPDTTSLKKNNVYKNTTNGNSYILSADAGTWGVYLAKGSDGYTPVKGTDYFDGDNGTNGTRTAVLEMYQWATSAPTSWPSGSSTYTWSSGTFTEPATPNSWTPTPGTPTAGKTLYVVRQVYTDTSTSATSAVTWAATSSAPYGAAGTNGVNGSFDPAARAVLSGTGGVVAGDLEWDTGGNRTAGKGVALTSHGIVAHNGTKNTVVINGTTGAASFGGDLDAAGGTFNGTLNVKSAASGARMEMTNSVLKVFDSGGVLRVKIGDLTA